MASRGLRDMDGGVERITDAAVIEAVRRQARGVHLRSILTAVVVTAAALAVP